MFTKRLKALEAKVAQDGRSAAVDFNGISIESYGKSQAGPPERKKNKPSER
jgi:hypothetical protein